MMVQVRDAGTSERLAVMAGIEVAISQEVRQS